MTNSNPVNVDKSSCMWCWACVWVCPKIFDFDENNKADVVKQPKNEEEMECAKQAKEVCPVQAIIVEE